MANEWNEIQTHRKFNPYVVLVLTLLLLEVFGLGNVAERDSGIYVTTPTERYAAPHSSILRIGLATTLYLLIALIMVRGGREREGEGGREGGSGFCYNITCTLLLLLFIEIIYVDNS